MRIPTALAAFVVLACAVLPGVAQRKYFVTVGSENHVRAGSDHEMQIYDLVNRRRSQQGLNFLFWDENLAAIARRYSRRMADGEFFGHVDPNGQRIQDRAESAGLFNWRKVGENLFQSKNVDDFSLLAVKMWMESPTHRENILDRSYSSAGVGVATASDGRVYVTQIYLQK
jgi:uncharacterized protein YkwD